MQRVATFATRGKYSRRQFRRAPLGSKQGNKNFLKGTGGRRIGHHTTKGRYVVLPHRTLEISAPSLEGFTLTPYVPYSAPHVTAPPHSVADVLASAEAAEAVPGESR